jgi:LysM repeat protein
MRPDQHTPFDVEADEAADITRQFWGSSKGWVSHDAQRIRDAQRIAAHGTEAERTDPAGTGSLAVIREGLAAFRPRRRDDVSGHLARTRRHGVVTPAPSSVTGREATLGELATGHGADGPAPGRREPADDLDGAVGREAGAHEAPDHDGQWWDDDGADDGLVPLSPIQPLVDRIGLSAVDPLLLRIGVMVVVAVLLVPIAFALRSDRADAGVLQPAPGVSVDAEVDGSGAQPSGGPSAGPGSDPATAPSGQDAAADAVTTDAVTTDAVTTDGAAIPEVAVAQSGPTPVTVAEVPAPASGVSDAATVSATAERLVPDCPQTYEAGVGDSWYRIAEASGVSPGAVMAENRATIDTPIFPGDEICLPADADIPEQPTTTVAPTTAPSTAPPTTAASTTTVAPTTTSPAPTTRAEVQQIIRDVWPDELEQKALDIAWRESRYEATAYNGWCCYGVFQLYWSVHQSWLDDYGVYTASDLFDARKNVQAAYGLYQRAGGWGPWGG